MWMDGIICNFCVLYPCLRLFQSIYQKISPRVFNNTMRRLPVSSVSILPQWPLKLKTSEAKKTNFHCPELVSITKHFFVLRKMQNFVRYALMEISHDVEPSHTQRHLRNIQPPVLSDFESSSNTLISFSRRTNFKARLSQMSIYVTRRAKKSQKVTQISILPHRSKVILNVWVNVSVPHQANSQRLSNFS